MGERGEGRREMGREVRGGERWGREGRGKGWELIDSHTVFQASDPSRLFKMPRTLKWPQDF